MKDELWMRDWNDSQPRFSADLYRGIIWLFTPFRRLGEWIALPSAAGEDSVFSCPTPRRAQRRRKAA